MENRWEDKLSILDWHDSLSRAAGVHRACCAAHVRELVVHWITMGSLNYPFARVTSLNSSLGLPRAIWAPPMDVDTRPCQTDRRDHGGPGEYWASARREFVLSKLHAGGSGRRIAGQGIASTAFQTAGRTPFHGSPRDLTIPVGGINLIRALVTPSRHANLSRPRFSSLWCPPATCWWSACQDGDGSA